MEKRKRNSKKVEKLLKKLRQELVDSTSDSSSIESSSEGADSSPEDSFGETGMEHNTQRDLEEQSEPGPSGVKQFLLQDPLGTVAKGPSVNTETAEYWKNDWRRSRTPARYRSIRARE
ncbi:uncharacterized protein LOC126741673 [Anthonomus grandis grandis]|uniref:uncharacterized protein LOC126741673 n=1 Tax=Anthonomus grandis grandis TaxID=2921223 RepID=UPI002166091D|nr:uncharacterized protein LOC126741673 [Anthonomus grandis grandis]